MTTQEFWDKCNQFDWFYEMSDDHRVWVSGHNAMQQLKQESTKSAEHEAILKGFCDYHYSGIAFGTTKKPKPERPE